jgi:hypothetical protein
MSSKPNINLVRELPQPLQLCLLRLAQRVRTRSALDRLAIGLHPVPQGRFRNPERPGHLRDRPVRTTHSRDSLTTELRRVNAVDVVGADSSLRWFPAPVTSMPRSTPPRCRRHSRSATECSGGPPLRLRRDVHSEPSVCVWVGDDARGDVFDVRAIYISRLNACGNDRSRLDGRSP